MDAERVSMMTHLEDISNMIQWDWMVQNSFLDVEKTSKDRKNGGAKPKK